MKNELLDLMKTRRSVRAYTPEQVTAEALDAVLEAGMYAPSGRGLQGASLVAVQDAALIQKLSAMNAAAKGKSSGDPYYSAPTVILVFGDPERSVYAEHDACATLENMLIAAHVLGLGACWITAEKAMFETAEGKALLKEWGLPERLFGVGAMTLGHPAAEAAAPAERKADYVHKIL